MEQTAQEKASVKRLRDAKGHFVGNPAPPLVDFKVRNPIDYIKLWWAKVVGNEGVDVRIKVRPLTAIAMALAFWGVGFGIGRFTVPEAVREYLPFVPSPTPTPNPWKETAFTGILRFSEISKKYFLEVGDGENVSLEVLPNFKLNPSGWTTFR